jgi:hypothetical protein
MGWAEIYLAVAVVIGSPPGIVAAVRRHDAAAVVGVLVLGILGAVVLVGTEPARTLRIAIPLLAVGVAVSAVAWRAAGR